MDGARLFNAAVAMGAEARDYARHVDSVMFCLSKGLSAPVGSMLCGSADFIDKARKTRSGLGGTMRQSGVIAAAGLVALEEMVERLADDHRRARALCDDLQGLDGVQAAQPPNATNFVMLDGAASGTSAEALYAALQSFGVLSVARPPARIRLVVHRHIDDDDVVLAAAAIRRAVEEKP
jgi:threonine aldolase